MSQIWAVRVPRARVVRVGGLTDRITWEESLAVTAVLGGLASALGIYLFATGREKEAYALGIAGAVTSAFIGGAKLLGGEV